MKPNISEQLARIAITAAAAICGAVFSMSTASAQTFADLSLDSENGRVTSQVTSTPGALFCCQAIQSADDSLTSPTRIDGETSQDQRDLPGKYFISGAGGNNVIINAANFATHRAVYDIAAAFDSGDFDFTKPFMALSYFYPNLSTFENTPALRVAGITGGEATIAKNGRVLSVNISELKIGENAAFPQALTYQWKTAAGTDIANATLQTYTADSGATVQVLITDKAGEKTFTPILATAEVAAPPAEEINLLLNTENLQVTATVISTGGKTFRCCQIRQAAAATGGSSEISGIEGVPSPGFLSGASSTGPVKVAGDTAVYNLSMVLNASYDYSKPFILFFHLGTPCCSDNVFSNRLRIAGIMSGEATVNEDGLTLSVNISELRNVVGREPILEELTFQWQTSAGVAISGETGQTYTAATNATVQVQITDKAGLKTFAAITATAEVVTPADTDAICNAKMQVLVGTSCVACGTGETFSDTTNECVADTVTPPPNTDAICNAKMQILVGTSCEDCTSGTTFSTESNSCVADTVTPTPPTQESCNTAGERFDSDTTSCVACPADTTLTGNVCEPNEVTPTPPTQESCNTAGQRFDSGTTSCVACPANTTLTGNECVADTVTPPAVTKESCNANQQGFVDGACVVCTTANPYNATEGQCVAATESGGGNNSGNTGGNTGGSTASDNNAILYAGGAVVGALFILSYFQSEAADKAALSFSPAYNYSFTESGYAYNAGGRVDYQRDNLRLFWTATQDNKDGEFGDFRYSSGAEYESDNWAASFSESVAGKVADYDFSFAAAIPGDDWKISSVYRLHSRFEEDDTTGWESDSENSLSLEGVFALRGWELKPSAGFQWQNAEKFGETAKFGLEGAFNYKQWHITPAAAYQTNGDNTKLNLQITRRF